MPLPKAVPRSLFTAIFIALTLCRLAAGQTYTVLHHFDTAHGASPNGIVRGADGSIYGTTRAGGSVGKGTIFKLARDRTFTVLHDFTGEPDGDLPSWASPILDPDGNLYGITFEGGIRYGTIFKVTPAGDESIFYNLNVYGGKVAFEPYAVIRDQVGNFYVTTFAGGFVDYGVVLIIKPDGSGRLLYSFSGPDGRIPWGMVRDSAGAIYGVTQYGGDFNQGTVFKITGRDEETVLYSFQGGFSTDGGVPECTPVFDAQGNLYGTTSSGGPFSSGTVFKLDPLGNKTILYAFTGGADGVLPTGALVMDQAGNLFGATAGGGSSNKGTVFKVDPLGNETILHSFAGPDGANPLSVVVTTDGTIYGTTQAGGFHNVGVLFRINP